MRLDGYSRQEATDLVAECAKFAYGSGKLEGKSGGAGNIGVLGGRVVKFRTHIGERSGEVTKEMADSCAILRNNLLNAFRSLLSDEEGEISDQARNFIDELRQDLSVSDFKADGSKSEKAKSLLDRKVVAEAIGKFEKFTKGQVFDTMLAEGRPVSSKGVHTDFSSVRKALLVETGATLAGYANAITLEYQRNIKPSFLEKMEMCFNILKAYKTMADIVPRKFLLDYVGGWKDEYARGKLNDWLNRLEPSVKEWEKLKTETEEVKKKARWNVFGGLNDHAAQDFLAGVLMFAGVTEDASMDAQLAGVKSFRSKLSVSRLP